MRFFENGPDIPDELLIARDEGRVIFFCGAGVSRARAGLPDFFGLAERVIKRLGVSVTDPAYSLLKGAREIAKRTDVHGAISADRIFGLLERDFFVRDIETAVAEALSPKDDVDLSAHRTLIDLAKTPEGRYRLVTTNFDRLFEDCAPSLQTWMPPRLPDPSRYKELDGIIYLHGCTNKDYNGAAGDGFILTSSAFGRAYLSEGWATSFFKEILAKYVVVFIGYTADDPPVHYLLEALKVKEGQRGGIFAFQSGEEKEAVTRWFHKGVKAIPCSGGYSALWETLEAWAVRARNPEAWYQSVIDLAGKGPGNLSPHERGQVVHLVSTLDGARKFAFTDSPPSAEWLCVFDPLRRYAKPRHIGRFTERGSFIDPFDVYGLDSDVAPEKIDPEDYTKKREAPEGASDVFAPNRLDYHNSQDYNLPSFRGSRSANAPTLSPRLIVIGTWIGEVADQPASVWWAADQKGLHPHVQYQVKDKLERSKDSIQPVIQRAWRYLFEALEVGDYYDPHRDIYGLKKIVDNYGWDSAAVRQYAFINRPYLTVNHRYIADPTPPNYGDDLRLDDLLNLDVEYPPIRDEVELPDEWVEVAVIEMRKNLERALQLETELGGYGLIHISPIEPDKKPGIDQHGRITGLSGHLISFTRLFTRLVKSNLTAARHELFSWPISDDTIFSLLKIWACGIAELVSPNTFGKIFMGLSDDAFWGTRHQRDLLLVLAKRWNELHADTKKEIENRIFKGRAKRDGEEDDIYKERRARAALNRLTWLANNGCELSTEMEPELGKLQKSATHWKPEHATRAVKSLEARGGRVKIETECSSLVRESLGSLLSKAAELKSKGDNFLIENDPYKGLSGERPLRAFSALTHAARQDEYPIWAWQTFLDHEARKKDNPKLSALIAERLIRSPENVIVELAHPVSHWLLNSSKKLASHYPASYENLVVKLTGVLRSTPSSGSTSLVRGGKDSDWAMWALNSPVGKIAQSFFNDPRQDNLKLSEGLPSAWLALVNGLLSLDGDLHRYALVMFSHNLNWFYSIDPNWTEANLLIEMGGNDDNRDAFWSGFLWGAKTPNMDLYLRMKQDLISIAKESGIIKTGYTRIIAGILLAGWGEIVDSDTQERLVTNDEMRDVLLSVDDEFRSNILWQLSRWSESEDAEAAERWSVLLPTLLREAWPLQKTVKTPATSASLCDLAFSDAERFQEISEIILPLLTKIDQGNRIHLTFPLTNNDIFEQHPKETLAIMHAVLPDDVGGWPYGANEILNRISNTNELLATDERLVELKRKWNAR